MRCWKLINLLFTSSLFLSCEFEPTEIFERIINKNVYAPQIEVVEFTITSDSIVLLGDKLINFKFSSNNQKILKVRFLIDSKLKKEINSEEGAFNIVYDSLTYGNHIITAEIYTESGTGSIADRVGAEQFLFSKNWKLIVSYLPPPITESTLNHTIEKGYLKIYWNAYQGDDFLKYIVYKQIDWFRSIEIKNVTDAFFVDSTYVGEGAGYSIALLTQKGIIKNLGGVILSKNLPELYFTNNYSNECVVSMQKSKFYNAVDSFQFFQRIGINGIFIPVKQTHNINDTTYKIINGYFSSWYEILVRIVPKKPNCMYEVYKNHYEKKIDFKLGYEFSSDYIISLFATNKNEIIFSSSDGGIYKYSLFDNKIIESFGNNEVYNSKLFNHITNSPSGVFFTCYNSYNTEFIWGNTLDFAAYNSLNINSYCGINSKPDIPVSDNGIAIMNNENGGFYLYKFKEEKVLAFYDKPIINAVGEKISASAEFMFVREDSLKLLRYSNSQFYNIWSTIERPQFYEFDASNPNRVVIWSGSTFQIRNCIDFSIINEFELSDNEIVNIDYYANTMLCNSNGKMVVRSLTDGSILYQVPFNIDSYFWNNRYLLVNNTIIDKGGLIYFLK